METNIFDLQIRVLISFEDDEFVAHALELDLLAYGKTEKAALKELERLVLNQLTFAVQKRDESLVQFRAPKEYFVEWEEANNNALLGILGNSKTKKIRVKAVILSYNAGTILRRVKKLPASERFDLKALACA